MRLFTLLVIMLIGFVGIALFGADPLHIEITKLLDGPSWQHWAGTDELGRDVLARLAQGVLTSLLIAGWVLLISAIIGITIGGLAGWWGGWLDQVLLRITDVFLAFPGILLAVALAALMGPGVVTLILALSLTGWVTFARLTRAEVQLLRQQPHVAAAQMCGVRTASLWQKNILPNAAGPLLVEAVVTLTAVIVAEAGLSFLGLGIAPPAPSLGSMLREGMRYLLMAPHLVIFPGLVLLIIMMGLTQLGEFIRTQLDPRRQTAR